MGVRRHLGAGLAALFVGSACCLAQAPAANPAPCTVAPQPVPCGAANAPAAPDNAKKFPFPGETDASPAAPAKDQSAAPGDSSSAPKSSGSNFPFPGEDAAPAPNAPGAGSSSSSSSSGDDTSPASPDPQAAAPGLQDKGSEGSRAPSGRHLLHRVNPIGTKLESDDEREAEDLDVAHFYTETGDLKGAYLRSQDAVKTAPDDPDAHFALAQAALKMNKRNEAIAEYTACLKHDPDDKEAKAARKELAKLKQ